MKKQLSLFALALCLAATLAAQTSDGALTPSTCRPITVKFLGFKDEYGNRLGRSEVGDMLDCINDKKTSDGYKLGKGLDWVGAGIMTGGSILVLASSTSNSYEYTDEQLKLGAAGLIMMGIGLTVQIGGIAIKKSAVRRYNKIAAGGMAAEGFASSPGAAAAAGDKFFGISFGKTFFKQGVDFPKRLYIEGILFDDNAEVVNAGNYFNLYWESSISERFQSRAEFNWAQRGFGISMRGDNNSYNANTKSRYLQNFLEIAWLGQFVANTARPKVLLAAGPGLGFLTGAKVKARATVKDKQTGETESASSSTKIDMEESSFGDRIDFGLHLGVGSRWPLGPGQVCLDIRYFLGLKNFNDSYEDAPKARNRGWMLGLGYGMPF